MKKKTRKKIVKIIAILICIVFCFMALQSTMVASNTSHLMKCHIEKCPVCMLIQCAIHFTKDINYITEYIVLLNVILPLIYIVVSKVVRSQQNILVKLNVRLNE